MDSVKTVGREPTPEMLEAACEVGPDTNNGEFNYDNARLVWRAMWDKVPASSPAQVSPLVDRFNAIIDGIEGRCLAADGPVTPTLKEMRENELAELWRVLQGIRSGLKAAASPAGAEVVAYINNASLDILRRHGGVVTHLGTRSINPHDHALYLAPSTPSTDAIRRQAREEWNFDMDAAPREQTLLGSVDGEVRLIRWTKTSHVPIYGWCLVDQGAEDCDLCKPSAWQPLPTPPASSGGGDEG